MEPMPVSSLPASSDTALTTNCSASKNPSSPAEPVLNPKIIETTPVKEPGKGNEQATSQTPEATTSATADMIPMINDPTLPTYTYPLETRSFLTQLNPKSLDILQYVAGCQFCSDIVEFSKSIVVATGYYKHETPRSLCDAAFCFLANKTAASPTFGNREEEWERDGADTTELSDLVLQAWERQEEEEEELLARNDGSDTIVESWCQSDSDLDVELGIALEEFETEPQADVEEVDLSERGTVRVEGLGNEEGLGREVVEVYTVEEGRELVEVHMVEEGSGQEELGQEVRLGKKEVECFMVEVQTVEKDNYWLEEDWLGIAGETAEFVNASMEQSFTATSMHPTPSRPTGTVSTAISHTSPQSSATASSNSSCATPKRKHNWTDKPTPKKLCITEVDLIDQASPSRLPVKRETAHQSPVKNRNTRREEEWKQDGLRN
ncbi:hypothetical protein BJ508DRAFT_315343 [Ascobolus immersus RN42]|uniref:Uncharacterized protein n=1 Tax=Ascobolus immersus RN42 TaxID=1160509 RepID=A0A3N4HPZ6_ASCIM|nr:hypothetical protein BJ508DRAFT_315343 [Ascobolus immersus RN42]